MMLWAAFSIWVAALLPIGLADDSTSIVTPTTTITAGFVTPTASGTSSGATHTVAVGSV
jgi:hypothetical protein